MVAAEELEHRDLVVLIGLQTELAAVMAVRQDVLMQLGDVERLRQVLRVARLNDAYQMAKHPLNVVHVACGGGAGKERSSDYGLDASCSVRSRARWASLTLVAPK